MKISIIGSGFVGTALGKGLKALGNEVIFYDVVDKDLPNFTFTKDINHAIENSNISFICVPTPPCHNLYKYTIQNVFCMNARVHNFKQFLIWKQAKIMKSDCQRVRILSAFLRFYIGNRKKEK